LRPFNEYTEEDEYNYLEIEEYIEPYSNYYNNDTAILFSNIICFYTFFTSYDIYYEVKRSIFIK